MVDRIRLGLTSGYVSVAFWVVVYTPQIWECYVLKSGEGLSLAFLIVWLTGDITGVIGALAQHLAPTISLLGIYYTFCDCLLIYLLFYYRYQRHHHPEKFVKPGSAVSERTPLLENGANGQQAGNGAVTATTDEEASRVQRFKVWVRHNIVPVIAYSVAFVFILTTAIVAWHTTGKALRPENQHHEHSPQSGKEEWSTSGQIVGWISAFTYLASRVPQIAKNTQTKCQGLSLMMFCFSVMGNVTYCMQILLPDPSPAHIYINFSWLVGSAGTILLDFIVLGQFIYYRKERNEKVYIEGGESSISGI